MMMHFCHDDLFLFLFYERHRKTKFLTSYAFIEKISNLILNYINTCVKRPLKNRQNNDLNDKM